MIPVHAAAAVLPPVCAHLGKPLLLHWRRPPHDCRILRPGAHSVSSRARQPWRSQAQLPRCQAKITISLVSSFRAAFALLIRLRLPKFCLAPARLVLLYDDLHTGTALDDFLAVAATPSSYGSPSAICSRTQMPRKRSIDSLISALKARLRFPLCRAAPCFPFGDIMLQATCDFVFQEFRLSQGAEKSQALPYRSVFPARVQPPV